MRIIIDFDLCQGHANCMAEAPAVFKVDDNGFLEVLQEEPSEEFRDAIEQAVQFCPTGAISVDE